MTQMMIPQSDLRTLQNLGLSQRSRQSASGGHLTARGRRVVAFCALIPLVLGMVLTGSHQASASGTQPTTRQIVVHEGENLWDIASKVAPNSDPRETMWEIQNLNHMANASLIIGQPLIVPVR